MTTDTDTLVARLRHNALGPLRYEAADRIKALEAEVARLRAVSDAFKALLAIVEGECPSLVNEDSGANQGLIDLLVRAEEAMETESK